MFNTIIRVQDMELDYKDLWREQVGEKKIIASHHPAI